jgi:hypothetical protein
VERLISHQLEVDSEFETTKLHSNGGIDKAAKDIKTGFRTGPFPYHDALDGSPRFFSLR